MPGTGNKLFPIRNHARGCDNKICWVSGGAERAAVVKAAVFDAKLAIDCTSSATELVGSWTRVPPWPSLAVTEVDAV